MAKKRPTNNQKKAAKKAVKRQTKAAKSKSRYAAKAKAKKTVSTGLLAKAASVIAVAVHGVSDVLRSFGKVYENADGSTLVDATKPVGMVVTQDDINYAAACNGNGCVVGRLMARAFGDSISLAIVGYHITKVVDEDTQTVLRFMTPRALRNAIHKFDVTQKTTGKGVWDFPQRSFSLNPVSKSYKHRERGHRHGERRNSGGKKSVFIPIGEFKPRQIDNIRTVFNEMKCGLYSTAERQRIPTGDAQPVIAL
jgi:hypothetical protein